MHRRRHAEAAEAVEIEIAAEPEATEATAQLEATARAACAA